MGNNKDNAQIILSKLNELQVITCDIRPDIILVTESWRNTNICDSTLSVIENDICSEIRKDRKDSRYQWNGPRVSWYMYVKVGLNILPCDTGSNFNQNCTFVFKTKSESLYFYHIYRPPSSNQGNITELEKLINISEKNPFFYWRH